MHNYHELLNAIKAEIEDSYMIDSVDPPNDPGQNYERITRSMFKPGDIIRNINSNCKHFGSEGIIEAILALPKNMGNIISYRTTNSGKTWKAGDLLQKTEIQLQKLSKNK